MERDFLKQKKIRNLVYGHNAPTKASLTESPTQCGLMHAARGQVSIEFILILLLMLLYISTLILPNIELAQSASEEIIGLSQTRVATEKITDTANQVALSSTYAKQTIKAFVPKNAVINCQEKTDNDGATYAEITFEYQLQDQSNTIIASCQQDNLCIKSFDTIHGPVFECEEANNFPILGDGIKTIEIKKEIDTDGKTLVIISNTQITT